MLDKNNEVFFEEYCKTCKYKNFSETDSPCAECIAEPVNLYSHKPVKWEGADGIFSGPPPRPDHAYQRAVKYIPEKRKDKEKAIARLNIDAEYTGNKVQSIDGEVTDDQYPSATAVKKALEGQNEVTAQSLAKKIDAPSGCKCGEFLAVEEVDEEGVVKKVRAAEVQTDPPDWNENDPTKPGYIENRTHYKYSDEFLGEIAFTATSEKELIMEDPDSTQNHSVIDAIGGTALTEYTTTKVVIDGITCISNAYYSRSVTELVGQFNYGAGGPAGYKYPATVNNDDIVLVSGQVYVIQFYNVGEYYKTLSEKYFPNTIFSQSNAPVKFGMSDDGELNTSAVQGKDTTASGSYSHAEGGWSKASGYYSHAEGSNTKASGPYSHAEGRSTEASGDGSHAEGEGAIANTKFLHVSGRYNLFEDRYYIETENTSRRFYNSTRMYYSNNYTFDAKTGKFTLIDPVECIFPNVIVKRYYTFGESTNNIMYYPTSLTKSSSSWADYDSVCYSAKDRQSGYKTYGTYAHIVGNGTSDTERSNAYTLDWDGNAWFAGDVYVGSTSGTNMDGGSVRLATEDDLSWCDRLNIIPTQGDDGTITYSSNMPALFVYYEVFGGNPTFNGNSVECCLLPIEDDGPLTVLSYTGMSIDQNADGNTVLAVRFSAYVSGKHISAEIRDTVSGFNTDDEELLSTVVTVTESASLPTPTTAQVGQIVKVKAVDADGKVTETEAVDVPSNVVVVNITSTTDDDGNTTYSSDMTAVEIAEQWNQGKVCLVECPFSDRSAILNLSAANVWSNNSGAYVCFDGIAFGYIVVIQMGTRISDGSSTTSIDMTTIPVHVGPTYVYLVKSDDDPTVLNILNASGLSIVSLNNLVQSGNEVKLVFEDHTYSLTSGPNASAHDFSTIYLETLNGITKVIYSEILVDTGVSGDGASITLTEKEL